MLSALNFYFAFRALTPRHRLCYLFAASVGSKQGGPAGPTGRGFHMRKWLHRVRGAIGLGLTWAAAWFGVGVVFLSGLLVFGLSPVGIGLAAVVINSFLLAVFGFVGGAALYSALSAVLPSLRSSGLLKAAGGSMRCRSRASPFGGRWGVFSRRCSWGAVGGGSYLKPWCFC